MRKSLHVSALLAAAAIGSLAAVASTGARVIVADGTSLSTVTEPAARSTGQAPAQIRATAFGAWDRWWSRRKATNRTGYPDGPGWSNRHVQRMARKRRNQARHKRAVRGGR